MRHPLMMGDFWGVCFLINFLALWAPWWVLSRSWLSKYAGDMDAFVARLSNSASTMLSTLGQGSATYGLKARSGPWNHLIQPVDGRLRLYSAGVAFPCHCREKSQLQVLSPCCYGRKAAAAAGFVCLLSVTGPQPKRLRSGHPASPANISLPQPTLSTLPWLQAGFQLSPWTPVAWVCGGRQEACTVT